MDTVLMKGDTVYAEWYEADPNMSLAGVQPKVGATQKSVKGVVRHIRGDHPTNPTTVMLGVEHEGQIVWINYKWVKWFIEGEQP